MKHLLKNIFTMVFAAVLLTFSVGYNVVKCCCLGNTIGIAQVDLCGMSENSAGDCCGNEGEKTDIPCKVIYLKSDFQTTFSYENLKIEPKVVDLSIILAKDFLIIDNFSKNSSFFYIPQKSPPNRCGRNILSKKSVLII
ncbi:MAG: hypothetical protein LBS50_04965 [Prevotellaceae bacterium]|jgi:hypothetical protein|nr:hypothetical protein [Prevotellaceae bacterium]